MIILILIATIIIGIAGATSLAIFSGETSSSGKITGTVLKGSIPGSTSLIEKVGTGGLVAESHPATEQLVATVSYRYTGKNPDNYIWFNDELWRIIGVFDVDDGTGNIEKRIKLIRNKSIGKLAISEYRGSTIWSESPTVALLNSGDYWNRTGAYASIGLTEESRLMIDDAKWYLDGPFESDYMTATAGEFYSTGRDKWADSWIGKIALMYISDYGYATDGMISGTYRDTCLEYSLGTDWGNSLYNGCAQNNWLLNNETGAYQLTIVSMRDNSDYLFSVDFTGSIGRCGKTNAEIIRPSLYLKPEIEITGGSGTETDPYTLPGLTGTSKIKSKLGSGGLATDTHTETTQLQATTAYRYTGINPDNYVSFNDELWRIVGVFEADDGTGKLEQRIKLIRKDSIGNLPWNNSNGSTSINDWSKSTLMTTLNSGDYWNKAGSYASIGLTEKAKQMIDNVKWYLGATADFSTSSNGKTSDFYNYERGTTVYDGRPTSWVGKVGLMYLSDYGYATDGETIAARLPGGTVSNRQTCLNKELYNWKDLNKCYESNWLYNSTTANWTINPFSGYSFGAFQIENTGSINAYSVSATQSIQPTVYLKPNIKITGGTGTESDPYQLSL